MAEDRIPGIRASTEAAQRIRQQQVQANQTQLAQEVLQEASESEFQEWCDQAFNPIAANRFAQELSKRIKHPEKEKTQGAKQDGEDHQIVEEVAKTAEEFSRKNPEFNSRALMGLHAQINADDSPEEILEKLFSFYPDAYLVDEALDFLIKTTKPSNRLYEKLVKAKELLQQNFDREIKIGRNISSQAREFSEKGLGTATGMRDLYKWLTGTEIEPLRVFEELHSKFSYNQLKSVIAFLLHSLNADIKSKGPSMDPLELQKLFSETRTLQAILGVYLYFLGKMFFLENQFGRNGLPKPEEVNFEKLARLFIVLLAEKYPSVGRILQLATELGISDSLIAQAIVYGNYRDAIRFISPRLFKNDKHRQDLHQALIECVEDLDQQIEDLEELEEEENQG